MAQGSSAALRRAAWGARRALVYRAPAWSKVAAGPPAQPPRVPLGRWLPRPCEVTPRGLGFAGTWASHSIHTASLLSAPATHSTPLLRAEASMSDGGDFPCHSVLAKDASPLLEGGGRTWLDVRPQDYYDKGHVPGCVHIPVVKPGPGPEGLVEVEDFVATVTEVFPRDAKLLVGCNGGWKSKKASRKLVEAGFTDVTNVTDGYRGWVAAGLPVEK